MIHEKKKAGVNTTHKRKELYAQTMLEYIATTRHRPELRCVNPKLDANRLWIETKAEFKKQMIQFKKLTIPAAKPFDLPKVVYTARRRRG